MAPATGPSDDDILRALQEAGLSAPGAPDPALSPAAPPAPSPRAAVPARRRRRAAPGGKAPCTETREGGALVLSWSWRGTPLVFLVPFALFWNGFMVVWYAIALAEGEVLMALFGVLHLLVGVGLGYGALAALVNHTYVVISPRRLEVRHGPLRWRGARSLATEDIRQLYVRRRVHRGKDSTSTHYDVIAMLGERDGYTEEEVLLSDVGEARALWVEWRIEEALGIEDEEVEDAWTG